MSDHRQHKSSRFSDFEPPVTDAHINGNWDKIKYFLPNEKKRSLLIFDRVAAFTFLSIGLLFFGLIIFDYIDGYSDRTKLSSSLSLLQDSSGSGRAGEGNTGGERSEKAGKILATTGGQSMTEAGPGQKTIPSAPSAEPSRSPENISIRAAISPDPSQDKNREADLIPGTPTVSLKDSAFHFSSDSETYIPLTLLNFAGTLVRSDSEKIGPENTKGLPLLMPGARHALLLEFLTGMNETFTDLKNKDQNTYLLNRQINLYAGLGAIYSLKNKWSLVGHIMAGTNTINYSETSTNRVIVQQSSPAVFGGPPGAPTTVGGPQTIPTPPVGGGGPPGAPTTVGGPLTIPSTFGVPQSSPNTVTGGGTPTSTATGGGTPSSTATAGAPAAPTAPGYVQTHRKTSIQAMYSYNFQIGAGYTLLQRSRFAVDLSLQVGSGLSSYRITTTEGQYNAHFRALNPGLIPGITFSYGVTERTALVFKSIYFRQISKTEINAAQTTYDLNQNNLYLGIGLRVKL